MERIILVCLRHSPSRQTGSEHYVSQLYRGPEATSAHRLEYATDHGVVRAWDTSTPRQPEL